MQGENTPLCSCGLCWPQCTAWQSNSQPTSPSNWKTDMLWDASSMQSVLFIVCRCNYMVGFLIFLIFPSEASSLIWCEDEDLVFIYYNLPIYPSLTRNKPGKWKTAAGDFSLALTGKWGKLNLPTSHNKAQWHLTSYSQCLHFWFYEWLYDLS